MKRQRSGQVIITTSFLTVLIMMTIAFVAYSAAIFNTKPYFDDYTSVALDFRMSSEALTRHLLANLTAYLRSQGSRLYPNSMLLRNYVNTTTMALINSFMAQYASYAYGKSLSIRVVPAQSYSNITNSLYNGTALRWPGLYNTTTSSTGYSLDSYRYYLDITSDGLTGYQFTSTSLLMIQITSHSKSSNSITVQILAQNEADFEQNLGLLQVWVHTPSGWSDLTYNSTLFSYLNGNYTMTVDYASASLVNQISFSVFNPYGVIVAMNSTV